MKKSEEQIFAEKEFIAWHMSEYGRVPYRKTVDFEMKQRFGELWVQTDKRNSPHIRRDPTQTLSPEKLDKAYKELALEKIPTIPELAEKLNKKYGVIYKFLYSNCLLEKYEFVKADNGGSQAKLRKQERERNVQAAYNKLCSELGRFPTMMELHEASGTSTHSICKYTAEDLGLKVSSGKIYKRMLAEKPDVNGQFWNKAKLVFRNINGHWSPFGANEVRKSFVVKQVGMISERYTKQEFAEIFISLDERIRLL